MQRLQRVVLLRRVRRPRPALTERRVKRRSSLWAYMVAFNLLFVALAGCGALVAAGGASTVHAYNTIKRDLPNPQLLEQATLPQVTQLYDRSGQHLLYEFYDERRITVPLKDVAPVMIQASLAIEDANFYEHRGVDLRAILRAAVDNWRTGDTVSGASTITLARQRQVLDQMVRLG